MYCSRETYHVVQLNLHGTYNLMHFVHKVFDKLSPSPKISSKSNLWQDRFKCSV